MPPCRTQAQAMSIHPKASQELYRKFRLYEENILVSTRMLSGSNGVYFNDLFEKTLKNIKTLKSA